jgi:hypothetical protein
MPKKRMRGDRAAMYAMKAWLERQSEHSFTSQNAEVVRCICAEMDRHERER